MDYRSEAKEILSILYREDWMDDEDYEACLLVAGMVNKKDIVGSLALHIKRMVEVKNYPLANVLEAFKTETKEAKRQLSP